jgi:16S rRNA (guanine966-N2)-methyltransferase
VAGAAGGRRLAVPTGRATRPTADRVKEALFSSLAADPGLAGARVLDLYAGSGGLGLEAASRGAAAVTFVENAAAALRALRANVAAVGLAGLTVVGERVETWLAAPFAGPPYDIALLDPPYADAVEPSLAALVDGGRLAPGATVVVERASRAAGIAWPDGLMPLRDRRYGEITLCYGHRA